MVMVPCPGLSCGSVKHAKSSISFCCCAAAMLFKAVLFLFFSSFILLFFFKSRRGGEDRKLGERNFDFDFSSHRSRQA